MRLVLLVALLSWLAPVMVEWAVRSRLLLVAARVRKEALY